MRQCIPEPNLDLHREVGVLIPVRSKTRHMVVPLGLDTNCCRVKASRWQRRERKGQPVAKQDDSKGHPLPVSL